MNKSKSKWRMLMALVVLAGLLTSIQGGANDVQAAPDAPTYSYSISPTSATMSTTRVTLTITNVMGVVPSSSTWKDPDNNTVNQGCGGGVIREFFYNYGSLYMVKDYFYISACTRDPGTYRVYVGADYAGSFTIAAPTPPDTLTYVPMVVTVPSAPRAFTKSSPANGATDLAYSSVFLTWEYVHNADSYEYCYDTSNDNACTNWASTGTNSQINITNLSQNTTYYWQVRANNALGTTYANGSANAFWSFTTGENNNVWIQQTDEASWSARNSHVAEVLSDGSIILIGGYDGSRPSDAWRSTDLGATWTLQTSSGGWAGRAGHNSVSLSDDSILIMGGYDGSSYLNDVWRSTDKGVTWTRMTSSANWPGRTSFGCTALSDNSILVMGGFMGGSSYSKYVYRSTDNGATWNVINTSVDWSGRSDPVVVTLSDDSIVLMGGRDSSYNELNDVWRSTDMGATWTQMTANASWSARWHHTAVALSDDSIVLIGGEDENGHLLNDVWISTDMGATWTEITTTVPWNARDGHAIVALSDNSIVLMGGNDGDRLNDVWRFIR